MEFYSACLAIVLLVFRSEKSLIISQGTKKKNYVELIKEYIYIYI